jgi:hypothetical protein
VRLALPPASRADANATRDPSGAQAGELSLSPVASWVSPVPSGFMVQTLLRSQPLPGPPTRSIWTNAMRAPSWRQRASCEPQKFVVRRVSPVPSSDTLNTL